MTHNPHASAYPVGGVPWSAEEDATLIASKTAGLQYYQIADQLPKRTVAAVKCRYRQIGLTPEVRAALALKKSKPSIRATRIQYAVAPAVPPAVLRDRDCRLTARKSLTAIICGDPPAGYSALERRS